MEEKRRESLFETVKKEEELNIVGNASGKHLNKIGFIKIPGH